MKLWIDDIRDPKKLGLLNWTWVKTYEEAIQALDSGQVAEVSIDHDLSVAATIGQPAPDEKTGYSIVQYMAQKQIWPGRIYLHTMNPVGRQRMSGVLRDHQIPFQIWYPNKIT